MTAILKTKNRHIWESNFIDQQRTKTRMLSWHRRCRTLTFVSTASNFKEWHCDWFYNIVKVNAKEKKRTCSLAEKSSSRCNSHVLRFLHKHSDNFVDTDLHPGNGRKSQAIKPLFSSPVPQICFYSFQCREAAFYSSCAHWERCQYIEECVNVRKRALSHPAKASVAKWGSFFSCMVCHLVFHISHSPFSVRICAVVISMR